MRYKNNTPLKRKKNERVPRYEATKIYMVDEINAIVSLLHSKKLVALGAKFVRCGTQLREGGGTRFVVLFS